MAITNCDCVSAYQDEKYGRGRRVANPMKDNKGIRCTVCSKIHTVAAKEDKRKEKGKKEEK